MDKEQFEKIFNACMKVDYIYCDGIKYKHNPSMIIRDFDSGHDNSAESDREFTNLNEALDYFKDLQECRIMDVSGSIYYDYDGLSLSGKEAIADTKEVA